MTFKDLKTQLSKIQNPEYSNALECHVARISHNLGPIVITAKSKPKKLYDHYGNRIDHERDLRAEVERGKSVIYYNDYTKDDSKIDKERKNRIVIVIARNLFSINQSVDIY